MRNVVIAALFATLIVACNRAALRIPGASGAFPPASTAYVAAAHIGRELFVASPIDERPDHYGQEVAGTSWTGCSTDPFWKGAMRPVLARELERELAKSGLFDAVSAAHRSPGALVLETRVRAFCAQAYGFLFIRVAGIVALDFELRDGEVVLSRHTVERVVTDADDEYTGPGAGMIEQVMKRLMSDSLREALRQLLSELDRAAAARSASIARRR